jgi:diacylglycerol kinase (ATP)
MGGIGVITNPRSRANLRNPRIAQRLGYILGEKGTLEQPADHEELADVARRFKQRDIDVLCINGGDGTMHTALTAMVKAYDGRPLPKVAILRTGTMNTVARGVGVWGTAAEILAFVVQRYHAEEPLPTARRWTLEVDGSQYGFLFGNGLIARFLEVYYEGSEPTPTKAAWLLLRAVSSAFVGGPLIRRLLTPYDGEVELDGVRWPANRWMAVSAGTSHDIGIGFRPFWKALTHPEHMHAFGVATLNPVSIVRELPRIYLARQVLGDDMYDGVARKLVLRSSVPIDYMVDGDFHKGGTELVVRTGPAVDFVVPEY